MILSGGINKQNPSLEKKKVFSFTCGFSSWMLPDMNENVQAVSKIQACCNVWCFSPGVSCWRVDDRIYFPEQSLCLRKKRKSCVTCGDRCQQEVRPNTSDCTDKDSMHKSFVHIFKRKLPLKKKSYLAQIKKDTSRFSKFKMHWFHFTCFERCFFILNLYFSYCKRRVAGCLSSSTNIFRSMEDIMTKTLLNFLKIKHDIRNPKSRIVSWKVHYGIWSYLPTSEGHKETQIRGIL